MVYLWWVSTILPPSPYKAPLTEQNLFVRRACHSYPCIGSHRSPSWNPLFLWHFIECHSEPRFVQSPPRWSSCHRGIVTVWSSWFWCYSCGSVYFSVCAFTWRNPHIPLVSDGTFYCSAFTADSTQPCIEILLFIFIYLAIILQFRTYWMVWIVGANFSYPII